MNRIKNTRWKHAITVASFLIVISLPCLLMAQDTPTPESLSLKGPRILTIPNTADYSIVVFNADKKSKENTEVLLYLPKNLKIIGATHKGTLTPPKGDRPTTITWPLGSIAPGKQIKIKFRVQATKRGNALIDATCVDSTQTTPIKVSTTTMIIGVPNIQMSCFDTEDPVAVGKNTTYVLEIQNAGSSPGTNIKIDYQIPEQMTFVSANIPPGLKYTSEGNLVKFSHYPILEAGKKITYRIVCKVIDEGSAKSKATLTYDQSEKPMFEEETTSCFR
ncbi:MAG: hypothetical protein HUN04_14770 [Desulfobacter sp.]|nr:MAG: hypothetical protein HUN04_14770 [Desulfobacter sp.]